MFWNFPSDGRACRTYKLHKRAVLTAVAAALVVLNVVLSCTDTGYEYTVCFYRHRRQKVRHARRHEASNASTPRLLSDLFPLRDGVSMLRRGCGGGGCVVWWRGGGWGVFTLHERARNPLFASRARAQKLSGGARIISLHEELGSE